MQKRSSFRRLLALACLLAWIVPTSPAAGGVPGEINFQGLLLDSSGEPTNAMVDLIFTLYASASGGSALWSETHDDVQVLDGVYDVALGSTTPIGSEVLEGGNLYLEVSVEGETLSPRQRLLAVPYAIRAQVAETSQSVTAPSAQVPAANATTVPDPTSNPKHISATIGADGLPVIAYYADSPGGGLRVLKCGNASCSDDNTVSNVVPAAGEYGSIAIGADGFPVIAFTDSAGLKVAKCSDSGCTGGVGVILVDSGTRSDTSITIGADGFPVVAYVDDDAASHLKVVKCGDATCDQKSNVFLSTSASVYDTTSIAMGPDGRLHVAFSDGDDPKLASCTDSGCSALFVFTVLASPTAMRLPSLAVAADGLPLIALYDDDSVSVIKCPTWTCPPATTSPQVLDTAGSDPGAGRRVSLTIGPDGLPMIAYVVELDSPPRHGLKYIRCNTSDCSSFSALRVLNDPGEESHAVGLFSSITVGADGRPVIAYRDDDAEDLKVIRCANRLCLSNWTRR